MPPSHPRVKGTAFLVPVKMVRALRERAVPLLPAHLHRFLEERILPSSWYPEEDVIAVASVAAQLLPLPAGRDPWEEMGRLLARHDLYGIYRSLVRPGDPLRTLQLGRQLWAVYRDTGVWELQLLGPASARVRLSDVGPPSEERCRLLGGYYSEYVMIGGGREVVHEQVRCTSRRDAACEWMLSWE